MAQIICFFCILCFTINYTFSNQINNLVHMCDSEIYCQGPILEAVNRLGIFSDSKDYVDMPLVKSQKDTLADFNYMFPKATDITTVALKSFLKSHFREPGHELVPHKPSDWNPDTGSFKIINDCSYRQWAQELHHMWQDLCKQVDETILSHLEKTSLIYIPYPFFVPGGRFCEYYYWDSYWTIKGTLISGMYNTTKYMIKNYIELVNKFGFVPNGGRVYYMKRSQPPMLIQMVHLYYEYTKDIEFIVEVLPALEKEYLFWENSRSISVTLNNGKTYTMYHYSTPSNVPRPESYHADVENAKTLNDAQTRESFFSNIASTAESGWDFSTRWFGDHRTIQTVKTKQILPVDLNAFICRNLNLLSEMFEITGSSSKSSFYAKKYNQFVSAFMDVFYNSTSGVWFDYDLDLRLHNVNFYLSLFVPLYTGCFQFSDNNTMEKALKYLNDSGVLSYPAGVPTSLVNSSQQWDFPNGWPPLNHMLIEGLRRTGHPLLEDTAFHLADKWLANNYLLYKETTQMFEKYDVTKTATAGGAGEYSVQIGFGWTNGVALDLLQTYGHRLTAPNYSPNSKLSKNAFIFLLMTFVQCHFAIIMSFVA